MGDHAGALEIEQDGLERRRRVLGENHPDTVATAAALATTLWQMGDTAAARAIFEDVVGHARRVLGVDGSADGARSGPTTRPRSRPPERLAAWAPWRVRVRRALRGWRSG